MESSKEKTKRKLIKLLSDYDWKQEVSLFVTIPAIPKTDDVDDKAVRKEIREQLSEFTRLHVMDQISHIKQQLRKNKHVRDLVHLVRVRKLTKSLLIGQIGGEPFSMNLTQYYLQILSTGSYDTTLFNDKGFNVLKRKVNNENLSRAIGTIKKQRLYELDNLNAYSILNRAKLSNVILHS